MAAEYKTGTFNRRVRKLANGPKKGRRPQEFVPAWGPPLYQDKDNTEVDETNEDDDATNDRSGRGGRGHGRRAGRKPGAKKRRGTYGGW